MRTLCRSFFVQLYPTYTRKCVVVNTADVTLWYIWRCVLVVKSVVLAVGEKKTAASVSSVRQDTSSYCHVVASVRDDSVQLVGWANAPSWVMPAVLKQTSNLCPLTFLLPFCFTHLFNIVGFLVCPVCSVSCFTEVYSKAMFFESQQLDFLRD